MREDLLLRLPTCERWLINCWLLAVPARLENTGSIGLSSGNPGLNLRYQDQGIIGESCAAIQQLLVPGLTLYATLKPSTASWTKIPTTLTRQASK